MAKQHQYATVAGFIVVILILAYIAYLLQSAGGMALIIQPAPEINLNIPQNELDPYYKASLFITPDRVCAGDLVLGVIASNMPNGVCSIWYNPDGTWRHFKYITLDSTGQYGESQRITAVGSAYFQAACVLNGRYARTNTEFLTVVDCSTPTTTTLSSSPTTTLTGGGDDGGGMACSAVWNPTQSTCDAAYCLGLKVCVYKPATLTTQAYCMCEECTVGTADCQGACVNAGYSTSVCSSVKGCPSGYSQASGGAFGCTTGVCGICCCGG